MKNKLNLALLASMLVLAHVCLADLNFNTPRVFSAGQTSNFGVAITKGDLNGDGYIDVAVIDSGASGHIRSSVSVLLNYGDGTFKTRMDYATGSAPVDISQSDVDADGKLDLITANSGDGTVSILLGNGDGTFKTKSDYTVTTSLNNGPYAVRVADLNGDNAPDLALPINNNLSVLLNRGNGVFKPKTDYAISGTTTEANQVVLSDVNGDSKPDWVAKRYNGSYLISVMLNAGDGNFSAPSDYPTSTGFGALDAGDVNGDAKPDLVLASRGSHTISMALNAGDGSFLAEQKIATLNGEKFPNAILINDVDGDQINDVIAIGTHVSELIGLGSGTFKPATSTSITENLTVAVSLSSLNAALADFNSDGKPDLALPMSNFGLYLLTNLGNGVFQTEAKSLDPGTFGEGAGVVAVGDVNGDKKLDVLYTKGDNQSGTLAVALGNGDGTLQTPTGYTLGRMPDSVAVGDLNGDGFADIAVSHTLYNNFVSVLLNYGDGTFLPRVDYAAGYAGLATTVAMADLDADHDLDLVVTNGGEKTISVLRNNGNGTFQSKVDYITGLASFDLAFGDLDSNGSLDIAVSVGAGSNGGALLFNDGTGNFPTIRRLTWGLQAVTVGDIDGDGHPDIATSDLLSTIPNTLATLRNAGNGSFPNRVGLAPSADSQTKSLTLVDLDKDNRSELIAADAFSGVKIFANKGDGTYREPVGYLVGNNDAAYAIATGDMNGDGKIDLITTLRGKVGNRVTVLLNTSTSPILTLSSAPNFAAQTVGKTGLPESITITNTSDSGVTLGSITASGDFAVTIDECPVQLAKGASCSVSISFSPTALGERTGQFTVATQSLTESFAVTLKAYAVQAVYALSVNTSGNGGGIVSSSPQGINCPDTCNFEYADGSIVTLTASADSNNAFAGWSGACTGTSNTCQIKMDAAKEVNANFQTIPVGNSILTVILGGTGNGVVTSSPSGIKCGNTCAHQFKLNKTVKLVAKPAANSVFVGWGGACNGTKSCTLKLERSQDVVANFSTALLTISNNSPTKGAISSAPVGIKCGKTCSKTYKPGKVVTLKAKPAKDKVFIGWSGDCTGIDRSCKIKLDKDKSVTADFGP